MGLVIRRQVCSAVHSGGILAFVLLVGLPWSAARAVWWNLSLHHLRMDILITRGSSRTRPNEHVLLPLLICDTMTSTLDAKVRSWIRSWGTNRIVFWLSSRTTGTASP